MSINPQGHSGYIPSEPAWDVALLFPDQGSWTVEDYLQLAGNRLVEYSHGHIEVLPMPTDSHQAIVAHLYGVLVAFITSRALGVLRFAPLRLQLWPGKFREPDLLFLGTANDDKRAEAYWRGADLVIEVVSDDDRRRDLVVKRREYARTGIAEYWIVDPQQDHIVVLCLDGDRYVEHGCFGRGDTLVSVLLDGLSLDVGAVLSAP